MRTAHLKTDIKLIVREPIILLLYLVPILLIVLSKILIIYLPNILLELVNFDLIIYKEYIFSSVLALIASMLGVVTGFMMIDDRDGKIYELMQVTPLGRKGYLYNRLFIPFIMSIFYSILFFIIVMPNKSISLYLAITICISVNTVIIGILLFNLAEDKVKALTYAKAINILMLFTLVELTSFKYLIYFGHLVPMFWFTKIIFNPSFFNIILALIVHVFWLIISINFFNNKK